MGGGRGKQSRTLESSINMVANPGFESMAGLRLPADRTEWYLMEQQLLSKAAEMEIGEYLDGSYVEKPMFPKVPITLYEFHPDNDAHGVQRADAAGRLLWQIDANGQKIPVLEADGSHRIRSQFVMTTTADDYGLAEIVKLQQAKQKHDDEDAKKRAKAWQFLMTITSDNHRELIMDKMPTRNVAEAWTAIREYFEGASMGDRRIQLNLALQGIPKMIGQLTRTPSCAEVQIVVSAIRVIVNKLASLQPPTEVPDHQKKTIFLQSLPSVCDEQLQMMQSMEPNMSFVQMTERWLSGKQSMEFKDAAIGKADTSTITTDAAMYSEIPRGGDWSGRGRGRGRGGRYDQGRGGGRYGDQGRQGGRYGGRGRGRGNTGRGQGQYFNGSCNHCGKFGHKIADCRTKKAEDEKEKSKSNMATIVTEAVQQGVQLAMQAVTPAPTHPQMGGGFGAFVASHEGASHSLNYMGEVFESSEAHQLQLVETPLGQVFKHDRTKFVIDTGASIAVTPYRLALANVQCSVMSAHLGNGDVLIASHFGSMGELERVWWVPTAPLTLIPAQAFHQLGYVITFTPTEIILRHTPDMQITVFAERIHGVMTVVVDNFHGIVFEAHDDQNDTSSMPDLVDEQSDESDEDIEEITARVTAMGVRE